MIYSAEELYDYFWFCGAFKGKTHSVNVTSKVRKEVMTGPKQNKVMVNNGRVEIVHWKNLGGGVCQRGD
jgi:hypothetical protein